MSDEPSRAIPDRRAFKASEVCAIAELQPYVLRSWESEFPDLGLAKTPGGPRVYRRADVERVLLIKQLVFVEGLTLSGARRRLEGEGGGSSTAAASDEVPDDVLLDDETRRRLRFVRDGLVELQALLDRSPEPASRSFALEAPAPTEERVSASRRRVSPRGRRDIE